MTRVPTKKQYDLILCLGSGAALVLGEKRRIEPLLKHGWVTSKEFDGRYYPWVRITPSGLRALADAVERYGLPEFKKKLGADA